jgi:L-threonate 2-dehydrogenase
MIPGKDRVFKERRMSAGQIGLIGLGAMGMGMAKSLRRAGYRVQVFDVRREVAEAFAAEGGAACSSPAEVAAACEVLISVVVNASQTESVLFGDDRAASS